MTKLIDRLRTRRYGTELLIFGLGLLAFAVDSLRPGGESLSAQIVVPAAETLELSSSLWAGDTGSPVVRDEMVENWVRGEVLYREALRLGLDRNDTIVKRRLIQKMEYLLEGMADIPPLTQEELQAFYQTHVEHYQKPESISFQHVYFSLRDGEKMADKRARQALAELRGGKGETTEVAYGDPFPDSTRFTSLDINRIEQLFGEDFLTALAMSTKGQWDGPFTSRYGLHLVRVQATQPAQAQDMNEIYTAVARDYLQQFRSRESERHYAEIEARYEIVSR